MREKVSKTERLLNLISYMLRNRSPIPFSEIAGNVVGYDDEARLDSIEKRFDRDKAELRNMGIPVEYVDTGSPETSGYVIPRDRFFLSKLELDSVDAILLSLAGRTGAVRFSSAVLKDAFDSALRKLSIDAPTIEEPEFEPASLLQVSSGNARAGEILQTICNAVYSRRTIRFAYVGRRDEAPRKRTIDPYGLGIAHGEWYVVGRCHQRDAIRTFKLSRIKGNVATPGASDSTNEFDIPVDFRVREYLDHDDWDFGAGESTVVRVRMPRDLASRVVARSPMRAAIENPESSSDDGVVVRLEARLVDRFISWIASLGPEAEIIEPVELSRSLRFRLEEMLAAYDEEPGS